MIAKHKILKTIEDIKQLSDTTGLTDEQIIWVKDKVAQIELWKDTAVTKLTTIDTRLTALETKATQFQTALVNLTARVKTLESKII